MITRYKTNKGGNRINSNNNNMNYKYTKKTVSVLTLSMWMILTHNIIGDYIYISDKKNSVTLITITNITGYVMEIMLVKI